MSLPNRSMSRCVCSGASSNQRFLPAQQLSPESAVWIHLLSTILRCALILGDPLQRSVRTRLLHMSNQAQGLLWSMGGSVCIRSVCTPLPTPPPQPGDAMYNE